MKSNIGNRIQNTNLPYSKSLLPLFEAIMNSIQAIEDKNINDGKVIITIDRDHKQMNLKEKEWKNDPIVGFKVWDNGIGFDEVNFESFDTEDSQYKANKGGKGIGRFLLLKAFEKVKIESVFKNKDGKFQERNFNFISTEDGVENHQIKDTDKADSYSLINLQDFKKEFQKYCPKEPETIAYFILEHFLEYLRRENCPQIKLIDRDNDIDINQLFKEDTIESEISEITISNIKFFLQHVKLFSTHSFNHQINFCANDRTVKQQKFGKDIPNIKPKIDDLETDKKFIYACYVESDFLNQTVNSERTDFIIEETSQYENELSWKEIFAHVKTNIMKFLEPYLKPVQDEKETHITNFVNNKAPMFRPIMKFIKPDLVQIDPTIVNDDNKLEIEIFKISLNWEQKIKEKGSSILKQFEYKSDDERKQHEEEINEYFEEITAVKAQDLAKYVLNRKLIINMLEEILSQKSDGSYFPEDRVHNLIFPMGKDSSQILFEDHNLWLLDERLVFHSYLASDKPLSTTKSIDLSSKKEPDIIIFDKACVFKTDRKDTGSDGITIIEFKKPMRKNFSDDDPFIQIQNYIDILRSGKANTTNGRPISGIKNIPINCYLVCDPSDQIKKKARSYQLIPTIDEMGFYGWWKSHEAYIEVIFYEKLIDNAKKRNMAFFDKLGISIS